MAKSKYGNTMKWIEIDNMLIPVKDIKAFALIKSEYPENREAPYFIRVVNQNFIDLVYFQGVNFAEAEDEFIRLKNLLNNEEQ